MSDVRVHFWCRGNVRMSWFYTTLPLDRRYFRHPRWTRSPIYPLARSMRIFSGMRNNTLHQGFDHDSTPANQDVLILVVDDDPDMQDLMLGALKHAGMACVGANSVEQALVALQTKRISVTVLDW